MMTRERAFYIAYRICDYMRNNEMQNLYEEYEFCMYVAYVADNIEYAIKNNDSSVLNPYYEVLYIELVNVSWNNEYAEEVKELIGLLDECKDCLCIYKSTI